MPEEKTAIIPHEAIQTKILVLQGKKVMLDSDLSLLYEVEPRVLNQAVKRNIQRFPADFMFQLTKEEVDSLRSQIVTLKRGQHSKYLPYAFTEHGILMLSSVLNSERAVQVNIQIMRTFTKMREMLVNYQELKQKIENMERKVDEKSKINSYLFEEVFKEVEEVKRLLEPPKEPKKEEIGFKAV